MNPRILRKTVGAIAACLFAFAVHAGDPTGVDLMNAANPAGGIHTSGRISQDDIAKIEAAGIRHVIDLAQDSETPDFDEAAAMQAAGIGYDNLPIAGPDALTRANVEAFDRLLADAQAPVLVHCASSNRVGAMAALRAAWIEGVPVEEAIATGRAGGLRSLEAAVRERLAASPAVVPVSSK